MKTRIAAYRARREGVFEHVDDVFDALDVAVELRMAWADYKALRDGTADTDERSARTAAIRAVAATRRRVLQRLIDETGGRRG